MMIQCHTNNELNASQLPCFANTVGRKQLFEMTRWFAKAKPKIARIKLNHYWDSPKQPIQIKWFFFQEHKKITKTTTIQYAHAHSHMSMHTYMSQFFFIAVELFTVSSFFLYIYKFDCLFAVVPSVFLFHSLTLPRCVCVCVCTHFHSKC